MSGINELQLVIDTNPTYFPASVLYSLKETPHPFYIWRLILWDSTMAQEPVLGVRHVVF